MIRALLLALPVALLLTACPDPAKNKPRAEVAAAAVAQPALITGGVPYNFSSDGSTVEWTGAKVTAKHDGGFKAFTGVVQLVDGAPTKSQVRVEIQMGSVFSDSDKLVQHLESEDFFDVAKFPVATFVSTGLLEGGAAGATHTVKGVLTLHGVAKVVSFPATIAAGGDGVTVKAEFAIDRRDFGIVYPGKPDNLIADEVLIRLSIAAKRKA